MRKKFFLLFIIAILSIISPQFALAEYFFTPHYIISDEEMEEFDSMSLIEIQRFLEEKGSGLARLYLPDYQDNVKKPAEIIWQAAQESQINPKVLLATLQKEQSLIQDPAPSVTQLERAMGYRCPDSGSCNSKTLHFGKQVDGAAWQFRQYLDSPQNWTYRVGQTYEMDGYLVTPACQATAGLYNYTPHYSGNKRFWQIWIEYWGKNYPDGSLLKAKDSPAVWYIQYGTRRLIASWGVLLSRFDPKKLLTVAQTDLEKYEIGPQMKFHNYSLLQTPDGKVYLLVNDELRYIASPEVFRKIGYNWEEVESIDEVDLTGYKFGQEITLESAYPTGALLQDNKTGGVYYVENGVKNPIYSREIMNANFKGKILTAVDPEVLDGFQEGQPVKFRDGELIKASNDSKVYVVANGLRQWLKTDKAFDKLGYKWDNIIITSSKAVEIHPLGPDLE